MINMEGKKLQPINKIYSWGRKHGYITLYVLWFMMELILNSSSTEITYGLSSGIHTLLQRDLKYALILYIVIFQRYTLRELAVILPLSALFYYSARRAVNYELFYTWLLILGCKETGLPRTVKASFVMLAVSIPSFFILCKAGVLQDILIYRGSTPRHALGFVHPNSLGLFVFLLCACWFYIRDEKLRWPDYIAAVAAAAFTWAIPNTRAACMALGLLCVLYLAGNKLKGKEKARKAWCILLSVIAAGANTASVFLSFTYDAGKRLYLIADKLFSERLSIGNGIIKEFGVSLFGQRIYITQSERMFAGIEPAEAIPFDNSYLRILVNWGIIVYIIFTIGILVCLMHESRKPSLNTFNALMIIAVYGVLERILFLGVYCIFILAISEIIYRKPDCKISI